MFQFLILTLSLLVALTTSNASAQTEPDIAVCDAYLRKERELGCTKRNYLVRFGYRYCRTFIEQNERFSEDGKRVTAGIRSCLLRELENNEKLVCRNALILSVNAHVGCYIEAGFCDLGIVDRWIIFENIWPELLNKRMRDASLEILSQCFAG